MQRSTIRKANILVVDDEAIVGETIGAILGTDGYEVETARNGQEALAILEGRRFDLVITDYMMPGMNGAQLVRTIKARTPGQPVGMISAYADDFQFRRGEIEGVDFVIGKPFGLEPLRQAVLKSLGSRERS